MYYLQPLTLKKCEFNKKKLFQLTEYVCIILYYTAIFRTNIIKTTN